MKVDEVRKLLDEIDKLEERRERIKKHRRHTTFFVSARGYDGLTWKTNVIDQTVHDEVNGMIDQLLQKEQRRVSFRIRAIKKKLEG